MKCPNCSAELVAAKRDGIDVESCPSCKGMWLTSQELDALEDESFDLGKKGSLVFDAAPSPRACPQCGKALQSFQYRDYDLQLEFCGEGHGYWLEEGEDRRVLDLMKKEEASLERKYGAEDSWSLQLQHWRTPSFIDKLMNLLR